MRVLVLADTHVRAQGAAPAALYRACERADTILHAGDVTTPDFLDELQGLAPTVAVLGNNDTGLADRLPERRCLELAGVRVAMVHDTGARTGRAARVQRWFPDADVVVFGHSHLPVDELGVGGQRLFNPGSPTQRRSAPTPTLGWLVLRDGRLAEHRITGLA